MMIHSWHTQHIKLFEKDKFIKTNEFEFLNCHITFLIQITFVDKKTNESHFLNPKSWTSRKRWSSHSDMIVQ